MVRDVVAPRPAVDIGAYAEILGRTWRRGEVCVARELAERRLAADDWEVARAYWSAMIDEDVARGGKDLVLVFAARFEASRRAGDGEPSAHAAGAPPELVGPPNEARAVAVAVPTYMAAPSPTPGPRSGGVDMLPTPSIHADLAASDADVGDATLPPVTRTGPALPFAPIVQGAVPPAVAALRGVGRREPDTPSADGDETALLPASALRDKLALPFPGAPSPAAAPPQLSLREYARFLVAFAAVKDADADAVRSRFGIASAAIQRTIGAAFATRFEREPAARAEFDTILTELRREGTR